MARAPRNPYTITIGKTRRRRKGSIQQTGVSARKRAYIAFIKSPQWRAYRAAWWEEYDRRNRIRKCYCCDKPQAAITRALQLHHRTYERLGQERYTDLVAVCPVCHDWITRQWRARGKTGLTMTLWQLTDERRRRIRLYQLKRKLASGG
jgi:hypothetical protein